MQEISSKASKMAKKHPNTTNHKAAEPFNFKDARGYNRVLTAGNPPPSKITDYILNPAEWTNFMKPKPNSIADILERCIDQGIPCAMCGKEGKACKIINCVNEFHTQISAYGESVTEICTVPGMGKGIFATKNIPSGAWIGEYLGELIPSQLKSRTQENMYLFEFDADNKISCDASQFGNWTRFMNHHCEPNVAALEYVYARRKVIAFRTIRRIEKGEQMFIWYGEEYFSGNKLMCRCSAQEKAHMPNDEPSTTSSPTTDTVCDMVGCDKAVVESPCKVTTTTSEIEPKDQEETIKFTALGPKCSRVEKSTSTGRRKSSLLGMETVVVTSKSTKRSRVGRRKKANSTLFETIFEEVESSD